MKKIIPIILITLIFANFFAPFSVDMKNGIPEVKKSVAYADLSITLIQNQVTSTSISVSFDVTQLTNTQNYGLIAIMTDEPGTVITEENMALLDIRIASQTAGGIGPEIFSLPTGSTIIAGGRLTDDRNQQPSVLTVPDLTPDTPYYISFFGYAGNTSGESLAFPRYDVEIRTLPTGSTANNEVTDLATTTSDAGYLPWCTKAVFKVNIGGCFAQILYTVFYQTTSFLFGLAGKFFDATFFYSTSDIAYRNNFVIEGWGIVRDFVNMFFIFVLLYIAFATILSIHGFKTKEMIINVVIIGLLINFSLFATQVIIDASNILARVFYNSETIKITDSNGKIVETAANEPIRLSESIVNKVDPQKLVIKAANVGTIQKKNDPAETTYSSVKKISTGTFILVTMLATAVNIVGLFVFLSVGLIFVGRVIGLWLAMIFVPFAFFSYTVPAMQGIDMIGWKKWWPSTLKLAFLAPIFMFFIYLIIRFLGKGLGIPLSGEKGPAFIIAIIVPFAFIIILLNQAKKIAMKFSGEFGGAVTKAGMVLGGAAVGGAALGVSTIGRSMGSVAGKAGRGDTSTQKYEAAKAHARATGDRSMLQNLNWRQKAAGWAGSKVGLGKVFGRTDGTYDTATRQKNMQIKTGLGALLNRKQANIEHTDHARHELDEAKDKRYKGVAFDRLSGTQMDNVKNDFRRSKRSDQEADFRQRNNVEKGRELTKEEYGKVTAELDVKFGKLVADAKKKISGLDRAVSQANTGSWHAGNLSQLKSDKREGMGTKIATGMTAFLSGQMRNSLMKGIGINYGSGQKDFLKDFKNMISEAFKSAHIKVDLKGGEQTGDDHGHGGGGGHH